MYGSLSGSRVLQQSDFSVSSQISAMRPMLNSTAGPSLQLITEYPVPKYRTLYPVNLTANQEQTISITFLSRDASTIICRCLSFGDVSAYATPLLERVDLEVWVAKVQATGRVPYGLPSSRGTIQLELSGALSSQSIDIEVFTAQNIIPVSPVVVPMNVTQSPMFQTPVHRTLRSSVPNSTLYNSAYVDSMRYSYVQPPMITPSPKRYHSEYAYDRSAYIPENVKSQVQQSIMEVSMRGSQVQSPNVQTSNFYQPELNLSQSSPQTVRSPQPVQIPVNSSKQSVQQQVITNEDLAPKQAESRQAETVNEEEPSENIAEAVVEKQKEKPSIKVSPQSVIFKPCEPGDYQLAKMRVKNISEQEIRVKVQLGNRSFATSTANCKYSQLSSDISVFALVDEKNEHQHKLELVIKPKSHCDLTLQFKPESAEYPLNCAKILLFIKKGESYQIPVLGVNGQPQLTALEKKFTEVSRIQGSGEELRIRNDGSAPAFVGFEGDTDPELTIIQSNASETVKVQGGLKIKWGNDYLRLLSEGAEGKGPWAEMVADLLVDHEDVEGLLLDQTEVVAVEK
ncbi:Conserved_hypothetical protein [Hexamita inflata]|uniref:Uncharacterized protein n=1 Tax=Hexamita inflata TaxID=28002 RepID=A0AA86PTA3_9EUKA|nr:Conserved hypothetical protein [Hexamita inflata]